MTPGLLDQKLHVGNVTYSRNEHILFVGEGSFTFSSMLATAFGSGRFIVATTPDSFETFCAKYGDFDDGLAAVKNLKRRGAEVLFEVDITSIDTSNKLLGRSFHRVIFNYPHAGYPGATRRYDTAHHQELMRIFFSKVSSLLLSGGEIHVTHKITVYKRWKFNSWAKESGLYLKNSVQFILDGRQGYIPCRGAGHKWYATFPLGPGSRTYIYRSFKDADNVSAYQSISLY